MIIEGDGNLLTADVDALVNTVNTVGVMGKGIALQFKRAYPANYAFYRAACDAGQVRLGEMLLFDSGRLGPRRFVINFPTKGHWKSRSRLDDVRSGLADLVRVIRAENIGSVAVPALGCGNGGLDWGVVRPLIVQAFTDLPGVRVLLYPPAGVPAPEDMPVGTDAPSLTPGRAVLLTAMGRYLTNASAIDPRDGISELEIQKIAYFLQTFGQPLKLSFRRALYGPYAEQLQHVLQQMEGHYVVGYGDRSGRVQDLRPIRLTAGAAAQAAAWLNTHEPAAQNRIDALLKLVEGYETPYSLELLATVHFAAASEPDADVDRLVEIVRGWSGRKARLFTADHIRLARERLRTEGLLSSDRFAAA
jgi:O-acetyl-ADP-ribose deacetylase (regulator of RNase III)